MKRGQKPSRHTRVVKTRRGRRAVRVNPHIVKRARPRRFRAVAQSQEITPVNVVTLLPSKIEDYREKHPNQPVFTSTVTRAEAKGKEPYGQPPSDELAFPYADKELEALRKKAVEEIEKKEKSEKRRLEASITAKQQRADEQYKRLKQFSVTK